MEEENIENPLKRLKIFLEEHSPQSYSIVLAIPIILLVIGFVIWDVYLYTFGFQTDELLRGQFILTGILFMFASTILLGSILLVLEALNKFAKMISFRFLSDNFEKICLKIFKKVSIFVYPFLFAIWFFFYVLHIFPFLPLYLGGGQPRALSLITTKENMEVLNSLGVVQGEGATYQTQNLCIVYEDSDQIYILLDDRVLALDKSLFQGFGSIPGPSSVIEESCIDYALEWSNQGYFFSSLLSRVAAKNLFFGLFGYPSESFYLEPINPEKN